MANLSAPYQMSSWEQQNGTQKPGSELFHPDLHPESQYS